MSLQIPSHFLFFNCSNLRVKSSKSTSSPPAELPPTEWPGSGRVLLGTAGRSGKASGLKPAGGGGWLWACFFGSSPSQSLNDCCPVWGGGAEWAGSTNPPAPIPPDGGACGRGGGSLLSCEKKHKKEKINKYYSENFQRHHKWY